MRLGARGLVGFWGLLQYRLASPSGRSNFRLHAGAVMMISWRLFDDAEEVRRSVVVVVVGENEVLQVEQELRPVSSLGIARARAASALTLGIQAFFTLLLPGKSVVNKQQAIPVDFLLHVSWRLQVIL